MADIVVSVTSYPKRILTIDKILESVINQTILPNKIVLYLSKHEFKDFDKIPDLKQYEEYGFEIHWCDENLKSHKKWFYALQEYQDDLVITMDDDILYGNTAIEKLLKYHEKYPNAVIARRAHLITCNSDYSIAQYNDWYTECSLYVGTPRMDLVATTGSGTLFPPHIFEKEIFNKDRFMELCPYADDLWLKVMESYSEIPVVLAEKTWEDLFLSEYIADSLYESYNKVGGNDKQFRKLMDQYQYTYNGKKMYDCIFSHKQIFVSNVEKLKEREGKKAIESLILEVCRNKELLVYGAGVLGKQLYKLLKDKNVIQAFIVDNSMNNPEFVEGIPVRYYKNDIKGNEKIVIALFDKNESNKVYNRLINEGVNSKRFINLNQLMKNTLLELSKNNEANSNIDCYASL